MLFVLYDWEFFVCVVDWFIMLEFGGVGLMVWVYGGGFVIY